MTTISRDDLMEAASKATGLTDFGPDDFEEGFSVLLQSYATDSKLTPLGEQLVRDELIGDLVRSAVDGQHPTRILTALAAHRLTAQGRHTDAGGGVERTRYRQRDELPQAVADQHVRSKAEALQDRHMGQTHGGDGGLLAFEGERVVFSSSVAAAPGAPLGASLEDGTELRFKVQRCVRVDGAFRIEGRLVSATRALRARLREIVTDQPAG